MGNNPGGPGRKRPGQDGSGQHQSLPPDQGAPADESTQRAFQSLIGAFETRVHEVNARLKEFEGELEGIDKLLRGDPTKAEPTGVINRLTLIAQDLAQVRTESRALQDKFDKLIWWIIGLLLTVAVGSVGIIGSRLLSVTK